MYVSMSATSTSSPSLLYMYVCTCARMYVCMYAAPSLTSNWQQLLHVLRNSCMYYVYVCTYVYVCMFVRTTLIFNLVTSIANSLSFVLLCICMYARMHACMSVYMYVYVCTSNYCCSTTFPSFKCLSNKGLGLFSRTNP